jgi:uncharacterized membrane protein YcaP (DUF421 family)
MEEFFINGLGLNLEPRELGYSQMVFRMFVLFIAMLLMMRLAGLRFLAGKTTFDVLLGFILGSMLSRAVNGSAPFGQTIVAGFSAVLLHRGLAYLTCRFHVIGCLVKGKPDSLVVDGKLQQEALARHRLSEHDLMEDLRLSKIDRVEKLKTALIERNGEISVQRREEPEK